jgi:NADH dehydrogenase FAD-containing subunit
MTDDENERERQMTFVLVGAGPTGVELAASMAQLAAVTLRGQFRRIDPARSSIILIEGGKRILPTFAERLAQKASGRLEKLGVRVMTGVKVEKVDENGVVADGKRIPSATVLWTAGVAPSPLVKLLGAKTDRAGRVAVGPFMNVEDVTGVFVVGDASSVVRNGRPVPGVAQAAIQQGVCRTPDLRTDQGSRTKTSVQIFRQRQHGGCWQEFRDIRERTPSHEWVRHLARLGLSASHVASTAAEPIACAIPVVLVLFYWAARLAIDPGTAEGGRLSWPLSIPRHHECGAHPTL